MIHVIFAKGFDRGSVLDAFSWSAWVDGRFLCDVGGAGSLGLQGRRMSCPHPGRITRVRFGHPLRASLRRAKGVRLSKHRRVCGLRANWLMVDKKGPVPPTSPDRLPSGRRNDVAARHHLVLQPRVSTVAGSTRRSGGDLWDRGSDRSDLERASPASGRFTNRPYVASPSLCERDGIFRLACTAESALTLRIRTLQLQAPS